MTRHNLLALVPRMTEPRPVVVNGIEYETLRQAALADPQAFTPDTREALLSQTEEAR